ncbi:MAG TPA: Ig-like domain-containing protein [Candidatus Dormibacteraeota bacterium]|nr:Ig-like domain-containing protein [Candidatus Dormibacteraeota bacterium]
MNPRFRPPLGVFSAIVVLAGWTLSACGGGPPQIVDYSPLRGAQDVSTAEPVQITFDHAVDEGSVASRLHLSPAVAGRVTWPSPEQLVYEHATLQPATTYEVILDAGYRDPAGNSYALRHHWSFTTEPAPSFSGSSPADGATDVDPADYLSVDFSRAMNQDSLRSAITFTPSVQFSLRLDPNDSRRAIVAPDSLLQASTAYQMLITTTALDADGNQLDLVRSVRFTTGALRPLHNWIAFAAENPDDASGGLWIVNETGFPRQLLDAGSLSAFSFSPEGDRLVLRGSGGEWASFSPGRSLQPLDFSGPWAAALAANLGYVYLDATGALHRELPDHSSLVIATQVASATVNPSGERVAFAQTQADGSTRIWGYDVGLRAQYLLGSEAAEVTNLSWAPDGDRLAYIRVDATQTALRVRSLTGSASTSTIAKGLLGAPAWLHDSTHLVISATVPSPNGPIRKAFLINVVAPPQSLTIGIGLPADPSVEVTDPVPSPDGHQIAFLSGNEVWLMNADGTRPVPLTQFDPDSFPYSCLMPTWTRS